MVAAHHNLLAIYCAPGLHHTMMPRGWDCQEQHLCRNCTAYLDLETASRTSSSIRMQADSQPFECVGQYQIIYQIPSISLHSLMAISAQSNQVRVAETLYLIKRKQTNKETTPKQQQQKNACKVGTREHS